MYELDVGRTITYCAVAAAADVGYCIATTMGNIKNVDSVRFRYKD